VYGTVTGRMRRAAGFNAGRPAVVTAARTLDFAEMWGRACRTANALASLGVRPGDRVGSLEDNDVPGADLFVGAAVAGAVRVPLYPRNSREAHAHMLGHTQCRVLFVDAAYAGVVAGIEADLPDLEHVVVRDTGYETWLSSFPADDPQVGVEPDDLFVIRHSGGTTGRSKGVAYTHRDWLEVARNWFYPLPPVTGSGVVAHAGPISHGSGYFFLPGWVHGAANLLLPAFEPATVLDLLERHGVTHMFLVPTMLNALARHPGAADRDWSRLACLQVGGAPITDDTALAARAVFGDVLYQGFGQTEALPVAMMGPTEWFGEVEGSTPLRAAGRVMPWADLEIWDEENRPLPPGSEGEIVVRTDGQMHGYWGDPELSATRIVDGWVKSGDIGRIDANGYLYVLDRADDMIISGGYNIWPAELETVLTDHPAVLEAAVFGVPDDRWGETPVAVVTVDGTTPVSEEELVALCRDRLGSYKKPSSVTITTDPLPKSPVGKLQRKVLREPYWAGHDRRVAGS
jgi:acyl-CoA synthetase (AMP-forming)/AMP-acid ligase II